MKLESMQELAKIIGEGFFADKVYNEKDFTRAQEYAKEILLGREEVKKGKFSADSLSHLKKYLRFLDWIKRTYGKTEIKNIEEAKLFLLRKILAIGEDTQDFYSFWRYLRKITLLEGSSIIEAY